MLINSVQLILNCKKVYSNLSSSFIQEKVEQVFVGDLLPLRETIANPAFGFFADKAGLIYNIRFFSPYIELKFDKKNKRDYIKDKSLDSVTNLFIKLYPSQDGQLGISTRAKSNPSNLFNCNKEDSVKLFARLFTAILKEENFKSFNFNRNKNIEEETDNDFSNRKTLFNYLKRNSFAENSSSIFKDKTIKLLLIQSYIVSVLDPKYVGDNKDYFELYLKEIADSYKLYLNEIAKSKKLHKIDKFLEIKIDNEVLESSAKYCKSMYSFPYSRFNAPESSNFIPTFIRDDTNQEDGGTFDEDIKFPDCADIALLHLCNCLFFFKGDSNRDYTLDHLPNTRSKHLKNFYEKYKKITTLTLEIRKEWSKVVQDLNNLEIPDMDSNYPTDYISYVNDTNNEIFPGIINMMNVLIRITGLDAKEIFPNKFTDENLIKSLKKLIEKISVKVNGKSVAELNIEPDAIKEHKNLKKTDFIGTFKINFTYDDGNDKEIVIYQGEIHATVELIKEENNPFFTKEEKHNLKSKLESSKYQDLMFKCLLFPEDENLEWKNKTDLHEIYLRSRINNDNLKVKFLDRICNIASTINDTKMIENVEKIISLVFSKVEFGDIGTRDMFKKFLCFKTSAIKPDDVDTFIECYINDSHDYPLFLRNKWEEFFSKNFSDLEKFEIPNLYISSIKSNSVAKLISNFKNLNEIDFRDCCLNEIQLDEIIENLNNPDKIIKINLSHNEGLIIPENIKNLTSLKNLDVSYCDMDSIPDSIFLLSFLEELNLSGNRELIIPENIKNLTSLKKLDLSSCKMDSIPDSIFLMYFLEELNLSGNRELIISENIKNLTSLKKLDFSYCDMDSIPDSFFLLKFLEELKLSHNEGLNIDENIKNLTSLKNLDVSSCDMDSIPDSIFLLSFLEELKLSHNKGLVISENIKNLTSLKKLDASYCDMDSIPDSVFLLNTLEELNLSFNCIRRLSINIKNLTKLKLLNLQQNRITDFPFEIRNLTELENINLSSNNISSLSPEIFKNLSKLQIIALSYSSISNDYLKELFRFINPIELDISHNRVGALPINIENFTKLKHLNIVKTKIKDLPFTMLKLQDLEILVGYISDLSVDTNNLFKRKVQYLFD